MNVRHSYTLLLLFTTVLKGVYFGVFLIAFCFNKKSDTNHCNKTGGLDNTEIHKRDTLPSTLQLHPH